MPSIEAATQAMNVMAELVVYEQNNPSSSSQHKKMLLGNYAVTCALSAEPPSLENIRENFINGLVNAGADLNEAEAVVDIIANINSARYFSSLSYLPKDLKGNGINRNKKGLWLNENEFIQSIISLKN